MGHTGRCNEAKNHDTILKVASELCHRHKDIHFVLVGKGVRENMNDSSANGIGWTNSSVRL